MYCTVNSKPSTFLCTEKNVRILDRNKNDFYFHPNSEEKITFNLPKGIFWSKSKIFRQPIFKPYRTNYIKIPKSITGKVKIKVSKNPHKASIFRDQNLIIIDNGISKICDKYKPAFIFLIGHELSHFLPQGLTGGEQAEIFCDENSANQMLCNGYNSSQINIARKLLFGDGNVKRSECLHEKIINSNFKR